MHGSGATSNPPTVLLGARRTAGFYLPGQYCPDEKLFLPYPEGEHEVRRLLRLLAFLGIPAQGEALEFPLTEADWLSLPVAAAALRPGRFVCLHPGASAAGRRWPLRCFAEVGDGLAALGWPVVLTGGPAERGLTRRLAQAMTAPALDLGGQTGLGGLAALLSQAGLLVCNDTGVSHLAAALRVASVVIFVASDPARWAPLDGERHRALGGESPRLAPAPADVLAEAGALLAGDTLYAA
jgi:ADP-heptose:LPS heptosyltransferase